MSRFTDDPEMGELIEYFVEELGERVKAIDSAWQAGDAQQLKRLAHQLKGAAAGYGFPDITEAASDLELDLVDAEMELSALTERVEALIDLCRRATADPN